MKSAGPHCDRRDIFISGTEGYHTFRIPSLLTAADGTLLAFAEGRRNGRGDAGEINLVLRRSTDGGTTWGPLTIVWADGPNTCGNPCPVLDRDTGTIWLWLTHNLGQDHEKLIVTGKSVGTRTAWCCRSEDHGATWTRPTEMTAAVKQPQWTWYATGPGAGLQTRAGRLVIPCDFKEPAENHYGSHVVFSDDHGASWHAGAPVPADRVNECEVAEREDGALLLNMRNYSQTERRRACALSRDGGATWGPVTHDAALIEPICQASLRRLAWPRDGRPGALLFSNPASTTARVNLTVRRSRDDGATWPVARALWAGPAAYSCLAVLADGRPACLYERGDQHPYERITLARFTEEWLMSV